MVTLDQLKAIIPQAGPRANVYLLPLNDAMTKHDISTTARRAAFLAQVAHESGSFRYAAEIWGPTAAQLRYEGRADLGNNEPGDGKRFKGRGLIQITGRDNYRNCSVALYADPDILLAHPEILETPQAACESAAWFWHIHDLNPLADKGAFRAITRAINGGFNGLEERTAFYRRALEVLQS